MVVLYNDMLIFVMMKYGLLDMVYMLWCVVRRYGVEY